jgi:uncharacterized heparinase superfamily protein
MNTGLLGLLVAAGLTGTAALHYSGVADEMIAAGYESTAYHSIRVVADTGKATSLISGKPMGDALQSVELSQGGDHLTVNGTVITWSMDGNCWKADVPTNTSALLVVPC